MTRILAIAKRTGLELIRDKRTLVLIFIAPILILSLMKVVFSVNSDTTVKIATVQVDSSLVSQLDHIKNIDIKKFSTKKAANHALKEDQVDGIVVAKDDRFDVTYANIDASKTAAIKASLKAALIAQNTKKMHHLIASLANSLPQTRGMTQPKIPSIKNYYVYGNADTTFFDKIVPILMSFFVFFFVFLISGMALLKERTSGTLARLLATPVKRSEIVFGYMLSYGLLAVIQTLVIVAFTIWALNVEVLGSIWSVIFVNILIALVALAFGILMSTFASSEFQMMQFIPLIIVPQLFFSGIIPLDTMANWVQIIGYTLPLKYAGDTLTGVVMSGANLSRYLPALGILLGFIIVLTGINIIGLRRYRKV